MGTRRLRGVEIGDLQPGAIDGVSEVDHAVGRQGDERQQRRQPGNRDAGRHHPSRPAAGRPWGEQSGQDVAGSQQGSRELDRGGRAHGQPRDRVGPARRPQAGTKTSATLKTPKAATSVRPARYAAADGPPGATTA
jgi:hypothetical protein